MTDFAHLVIPDFLRVTPEEAARRRQYWKGRKLTVQGSGFRRVDAAEARARKKLQVEYEKQQAEKRAARLAAFLESR